MKPDQYIFYSFSRRVWAFARIFFSKYLVKKIVLKAYIFFWKHLISHLNKTNSWSPAAFWNKLPRKNLIKMFFFVVIFFYLSQQLFLYRERWITLTSRDQTRLNLKKIEANYYQSNPLKCKKHKSKSINLKKYKL